MSTKRRQTLTQQTAAVRTTPPPETTTSTAAEAMVDTITPLPEVVPEELPPDLILTIDPPPPEVILAETSAEPLTETSAETVFSLPPTPAEARQQLLQAYIDQFKQDYHLPRVMDAAQSKIMASKLEQMINIISAAKSYPEVQGLLTQLRTAFADTTTKAFRPALLIGNLRHPKSGAANTIHPRTSELLMLLLNTSTPEAYNGHKGRVDVRSVVVGFPESVAQHIIQYYS